MATPLTVTGKYWTRARYMGGSHVGQNNNNNNNNNKPVIIGATGIVTRSSRKNLEAVPGKHSIDSQHKTAILVTSHIIRKVLQCEA